MNTQESILLKNVLVLDTTGGTVSAQPVSVKAPAPCNQTNAEGKLRSHENLDAFRTAAWETGVRMKMGFGL